MDWSTPRPAIWVGRGVSRTLECSCELRFSHEVETAKYKHAPCFLSSRMTPSENLLSVQNAITKQYVWLQQFNILPPCPYVAVRERFYTHIRTNGFFTHIFLPISASISPSLGIGCKTPRKDVSSVFLRFLSLRSVVTASPDSRRGRGADMTPLSISISNTSPPLFSLHDIACRPPLGKGETTHFL